MIRLLIIEPDATFAHLVADQSRRNNHVPTHIEDATQAADFITGEDIFDVIVVCGDLEVGLVNQILGAALAKDLLVEMIVTGRELTVEPVVAWMRAGASNVIVRKGDVLEQVEAVMGAIRDAVRTREQDEAALKQMSSTGSA